MNTLRTFGKYRALQTAEASYKDGYQTGLKWDAPWAPGGPWFTHITPWEEQTKDKDWVAFCKATVENNREWVRGWQDGVRAQTETIVHPDRYYCSWNPRPKVCHCAYHLLRQLVQTGG